MGTRLRVFFNFPAIWYIYEYIDICMYKPVYGYVGFGCMNRFYMDERMDSMDWIDGFG